MKTKWILATVTRHEVDAPRTNLFIKQGGKDAVLTWLIGKAELMLVQGGVDLKDACYPETPDGFDDYEEGGYSGEITADIYAWFSEISLQATKLADIDVLGPHKEGDDDLWVMAFFEEGYEYILFNKLYGDEKDARAGLDIFVRELSGIYKTSVEDIERIPVEAGSGQIAEQIVVNGFLYYVVVGRPEQR